MVEQELLFIFSYVAGELMDGVLNDWDYGGCR